MDLPSKTNRTWTDLVTGKKTFQLKFLAAKILLGRLVHSAQDDPSPKNVAACIEQVYNLYAKNVGSPSAQEDIKTIFG